MSVNHAIIGSENGLLLDRHQAIIWTNVGKLLIGLIWTNFSKIIIEIYKFLLNKMHLIMSSGKWQPFRLALNVLIKVPSTPYHYFMHGSIWYIDGLVQEKRNFIAKALVLSLFLH